MPQLRGKESHGRLLRRRQKIDGFLLEVLSLAAVNYGYDRTPECLDELLQKRSRRTHGSFCDLLIFPDLTNYSSRFPIRYKAWCRRNRNCNLPRELARAFNCSVALHVRSFRNWLFMGASQACKAMTPACDQHDGSFDFIDQESAHR